MMMMMTVMITVMMMMTNDDDDDCDNDDGGIMARALYIYCAYYDSTMIRCRKTSIFEWLLHH